MERTINLLNIAKKISDGEVMPKERRYAFQYGDRLLILDIELGVNDLNFYTIERLTLPKQVKKEDVNYVTLLVQTEVARVNEKLHEDYINEVSDLNDRLDYLRS